MTSKTRRLFSSGPSLPGGADSQRPAAVKGAAGAAAQRTLDGEDRRERIASFIYGAKLAVDGGRTAI
jgi:hypothetical protein